MGQMLLIAPLFPNFPSWLLLTFLLLPWLTIHFISFCREPFLIPRHFRYVLLFAMSGYGVACVIAEAVHFLLKPAPEPHSSVYAARIIMYSGGLSFIVFIRFCFWLRSYEANEAA
jgi:hypothetical protein